MRICVDTRAYESGYLNISQVAPAVIPLSVCFIRLRCITYITVQNVVPRIVAHKPQVQGCRMTTLSQTSNVDSFVIYYETAIEFIFKSSSH